MPVWRVPWLIWAMTSVISPETTSSSVAASPRTRAQQDGHSVKTEALSRMILFGEQSLRHGRSEYVVHHHADRPHQGKGTIILLPPAPAEPNSDLPSASRERLGGLLKYYYRKAA